MSLRRRVYSAVFAVQQRWRVLRGTPTQGVQVILPLLDNALSITSTKPLASQPDRDAIRASLLAFITDPADNAPYENDPPFDPVGDGDPDGLSRCADSCSGTITTGQVVKAVCGSVLGSTAVLMK